MFGFEAGKIVVRGYCYITVIYFSTKCNYTVNDKLWNNDMELKGGNAII